MNGYRLFFMCLGLSLPANGLYGQTDKKLSGTVVLNDVQTIQRVKVNDVSIRNLARNISTKPDNLGNFLISARLGDSLEVYLEGLPKKYALVKSYEHTTIYLDSTILLDEVSINATIENKTTLEETAVEYSKRNSIYFGGKPPIALLSPFSGSPITFFRELLGKDGKKVRRFNNYIRQQIEFNEIDAKFNTQTIKRVIPIEENEIETFKAKYEPNIEEINKWSNYELYDYIKQSYQDFKKDD